MSKKNLGETVLGWFVVREGEDGADGEDDAGQSDGEAAEPAAVVEAYERRTAAKVQAKKASPLPKGDDAPASVRLPGQLPQVPAGAKHDPRVFAEVFRAAQISPEEQERVTKASSLLNSLPADASKEVKRQVVEASLIAFNIPIDQIIEAGAQEIQALEAYIQHGERHTQDILADAKARIEKLTNDINEIRKLMELQVSSQLDLVRASNAEKLRVQSVLEFFGQEAVARVVKDSPKLVEPGAKR